MIEISLIQYWLWLLFGILIGIIIGIIIGIVARKTTNIEGECLELMERNDKLKDDNSKLSNALREKGIKVDQLEKKIKRLEEGK